jgi:hypothetical protein
VFEIGDLGVDCDFRALGPIAEDRDSRCRSVNRGYIPAVLSQPECVVPGAAGKIQGEAGL